MSLFSRILEKLGYSEKVVASAKESPATSVPPVPVSRVDVMSLLARKAAANAEKLDWRVSIVDLLKLLGLESSLEARKELADELGCPQDKRTDSAQMNRWLHRTVLERLAANGGNIPKELYLAGEAK
jgi:hypothetical protein